jgi:hypothetical protein
LRREQLRDKKQTNLKPLEQEEERKLEDQKYVLLDLASWLTSNYSYQFVKEMYSSGMKLLGIMTN